MSIAEKLTTVAENQQRVYDAGYSAGQQASGGGYDEGYEAGQQAEYNRFWDTFQRETTITGLYLFAGAGWNNNTYNPKRKIVVRNNATYMYYASAITNTKVEIDISALSGNLTGLFYSANIHTVPLLTVSEKTPLSAAFNEATKLANIVIGGIIGQSCNMQACPLTRDSIESVMSALSDTATGKTVTFKQSAVDKAFETYEGANDGSTNESSDWFTLKGQKTNWTYALG